MALGSTWCWWDEEAAAAPPKLRQATACLEASSTLVGVGLATSSMAITLAVHRPPPGLDENAYFLALSGAFFAGLAQVIAAAVCVSDNNPRARRAAGTRLMYYAAFVAPLAAVVGLSVASLLL